MVHPARVSGEWVRHVIDDASRGADGVRLADANGDGRLDLVCGWEEGGVVRVCLQPELELRSQPWPAVTVGQVRSPEDAVFVDLDLDGNLDVISSTEGSTRSLFVHWGPSRSQYLDENAWETEAIPCAAKSQAWMFALPVELNGMDGAEVIVGSKGRQASVSILTGPADGRRQLAEFQLQRLVDAGWIMSLEAHDLDNDGDMDVIVSDRKGPACGVYWLENPGAEAVRMQHDWTRHEVAGHNREVMFLDLADMNGDGRVDIVTATRNGVLLISTSPENPSEPWSTEEVPNPFGVPHGKAVAVADLNGDGRLDLAHTANNGGNREHPGATWMESKPNGGWKVHVVSGEQGIKFDLIQLVDIDEDGDLDWMTCEERDNLGVFWYENPN